MSVSVKWPPLSSIAVSHYNIYRADTATGPLVKIGDVPQPEPPLPEQLQFLDPTGNDTKFYRIEPVDVNNIPGQPTNVFQPMPRGARNRVFDRILNASGKPQPYVRVEAKLSGPAFYNNLVVPINVVAVTDQDGYWYLDLFPNELLDPVTTDYVFVIQNVNPSKRGVVPIGQTVEFKAVVGPGL